LIELACPVCWGDGCGACGWFREEAAKPIPDLVPQADLHDPAVVAELGRYEGVAAAGAEAYAGHAASRPRLRARVMADLLGPGEFAEVGPGYGELMEATAGDRWAVDGSLAFLRRLEARALPGVRLVRALADRLPFATGSLPALAADSVFQALPDRERFLCEARRALGPGGRLAFTVAYRWNYPRRPQQGFDVRYPSQAAMLGKFLAELGFRVETWDWFSLGEERFVGDRDRADVLYVVCRR
jgi:SAM-dependent methyltransferase